MKVRLGAGLESLKGKIGSLCGKRTARGQTLTKVSVPGSIVPLSLTDEQLAARARYGAAVGTWRDATELQRATWTALGNVQGISGFNYLVMTMSLDQSSVLQDEVEATTWDAPLSSLLSNMNRIRNQIVTMTGETWGTVSHSIAGIWAKFGTTTGHAHSGAVDDGAQVDHGTLAGLENDDHTRYWDADGDKPVTGTTFRRDVDNSFFLMSGGSGIAGNGGILGLYGSTRSPTFGRVALFVPNAAKTANVAVFYADGVTDTPTPVFAGLKRGATSVSDGGTITHGCGTTPTAVIVVGSVANEILAVTAKGTTTFTVAIKKRADGTAGTTQTVNWLAWL
jgi:hypothetical protein